MRRGVDAVEIGHIAEILPARILAGDHGAGRGQTRGDQRGLEEVRGKIPLHAIKGRFAEGQRRQRSIDCVADGQRRIELPLGHRRNDQIAKPARELGRLAHRSARRRRAVDGPAIDLETAGEVVAVNIVGAKPLKLGRDIALVGLHGVVAVFLAGPAIELIQALRLLPLALRGRHRHLVDLHAAGLATGGQTELLRRSDFGEEQRAENYVFNQIHSQRSVV